VYKITSLQKYILIQQMFIKINRTAMHYIPWHEIRHIHQLDEITLNHTLSRCLFTQPRKYKQLVWYNTRGPLLFGVVNTAVWTVLVIICNLELLHFKTFNEREVDWHWQYVMDIQSFIFSKLVKMTPWCWNI
jgi:hypothetical protein